MMADALIVALEQRDKLFDELDAANKRVEELEAECERLCDDQKDTIKMMNALQSRIKAAVGWATKQGPVSQDQWAGGYHKAMKDALKILTSDTEVEEKPGEGREEE